jgi:hypothetical protein
MAVIKRTIALETKPTKRLQATTSPTSSREPTHISLGATWAPEGSVRHPDHELKDIRRTRCQG